MLIANVTSAQGWLVQENTIATNWNVSVQVGRGFLVNEYNLSQHSAGNEMNHQFGWNAGIRFAKMIFKQADLGLECNYSTFKGYNYFPIKVVYLNNHSLFNTDERAFLAKPILYNSEMGSFVPFFKYNFINFSTYPRGYSSVNVYIQTGVGIGLISAKMGYEDAGNYAVSELKAPLFKSGKFSDGIAPTAMVSLGINYQLNKRIFLSFETNLQFVYSDILDGVPNYSTELEPFLDLDMAESFRQKQLATTGRVLIATTYFFNFDTTSKKRGRLLPWYSNRYRSYYSRYQYRSTEKDRKLRLPFYGKELVE
jgi:hypothetical protein